jgi:putative alpha-1,2-mannosidase
MGVSGINTEIIDECTRRELSREDFKEFLDGGYFERYTHIIDTTDACLEVADLTKDAELKARLLDIAKKWKNAFSDDGIMSENSPYYEGDRYNYSFRLQRNMEERVALAGGKERFNELLDDFFGYNSERVTQLRDFEPWVRIKELAYHRFEGFNNETDMETPYAYIFADRHDRLSEILHECTSRVFGLGKGALPGNNDSGGLSSLFMWNSLGIFPASGRGEFLIGSPCVRGAEIALGNGNTLKISTEMGDTVYVDKVTFNGKEIKDYRIPMSEITRGGELMIRFK